MQMAFDHTASLKGISQEDVKKKKKSRNRKKGNAQSSDDATSQAVALGKDSGQTKRSTGELQLSAHSVLVGIL